MKKTLVLMTVFIVVWAGTAFSVERMVLGEMFGNDSCPYSYYAFFRLDTLTQQWTHADDIAVIRYHVWWPNSNDPFFLFNPQEISARNYFYENSYTPHLFIDGILDAAYEHATWEDSFLVRLPVDSPLEIVLDGAYYQETRQGSLHVAISAVGEITQSDLRLLCVLTESYILYSAPNGGEVHNQIMRDMIPDEEGESFSISYGQTLEFDKVYTVDDTITDYNCELVVFVQSYSSKEVLQAARTSLYLCGDVDMIPDVYPITIAPGDTFGITGIIGNPSSAPIVTDVWVMLGLPGGGSYGPLHTFNNIPLTPGQYINAHLNQPVPNFAPEGTYSYIAYCGDYHWNPNNWNICDEKRLQFRVSTGGGGPYNVGLVVSDYDNAWTEVEQLLLASGQVSGATFVDARYATPSLSDLLNYDVVLVWSNYTFNNNVALGDVLADYVESGGAVVTANFCHYQSVHQLAGRYMTDYSPLGAGPSFGYGTNMVVDDPNHSIMAGVSTGYEFYDHNAPLQNNPYMVQHWDNGYNGTTVNTDYPQCVAINNYYGVPDRQWTGDVGQMMVNAVLYAGSNTLGIWVSEPPEELIAYSPKFNKSNEQVSRSGGNSIPATRMLGGELAMPDSRALLTASPNPFNAQTSITFSVPSSGKVNLEVYNLLGQNVATLVDGNIEAGQHSVTWDASDASSGIYFYKLTTGDKVFTKRMTLLK